LMKTSRMLLATIAVLSGGCRSDHPATAAWRGSAELRDSVWVVTNPDAPVFNSTQVRLSPQWDVELLPDSVVGWESPENVRLLHGVAYVLDLPAHRIAAFDTLGRRVVAFGREGAGPGEMKAPTDLVVTGDAVGVGDGRLGRFMLFDPQGHYLRSTPIPQMSSVIPVGDSAILVKYFQPEEPGWRLISGDSVREMGPMSNRGGADVPSDVGSWRDASGGVVVLASSSRPTFLVFSPSLRLTRVVNIKRPQERATDEQMTQLKASMNARLSQMPIKPDARASIVEEALKNQAMRRDIQGIAIDSAGGLIGIWSQISQQYGGGNAWVDVLSLSGVYLSRIALPRPLKALDLDDGRLVTLAEDSLTGTVTLRSARIELPDRWRAIAAAPDDTRRSD
jgi:hypothetical protein